MDVPLAQLAESVRKRVFCITVKASHCHDNHPRSHPHHHHQLCEPPFPKSSCVFIPDDMTQGHEGHVSGFQAG